MHSRLIRILILAVLALGFPYIIWTSAHSKSAVPGNPATHLSREQANKLEDRLLMDPENADLHCRLLTHYARLPRPSLTERRSHEQHLLWLICRRPDAMILGEPEGAWLPETESLVKAQGEALWFRHLALHDTDSAVLGNAGIYFIRSGDFPRGNRLIAKAGWHAPSEPQMSWESGQADHDAFLRSSSNTRAIGSRQILDAYERALPLTDPIYRINHLEEVARLAIGHGDFTRAEGCARELLDIGVELDPSDVQNFGTAVHVGNVLLGWAGLGRGRTDEAETCLLKAATAPAGLRLLETPPMELAEALWERGRTGTVTTYLQNTLKSIKMPKMYKLVRQAEAGETPNFDAPPWEMNP